MGKACGIFSIGPVSAQYPPIPTSSQLWWRSAKDEAVVRQPVNVFRQDCWLGHEGRRRGVIDRLVPNALRKVAVVLHLSSSREQDTWRSGKPGTSSSRARP